jgi:hypothetical protein
VNMPSRTWAIDSAHVPTSRRPRHRRGVCGRSKEPPAHVTPQPSMTSCVGDEKPPTSETFTLTIEAAPATLPAEVRLRHLLKHAWRAWGLRCVAVSRK